MDSQSPKLPGVYSRHILFFLLALHLPRQANSTASPARTTLVSAGLPSKGILLCATTNSLNRSLHMRMRLLDGCLSAYSRRPYHASAYPDSKKELKLAPGRQSPAL